jgi:hypothetical protein
MAKALSGIGILLALMVGGLALLSYLTRDEDNIAVDQALAEDITRAIATSDPRGGDVDLTRLARFPWDRVLIVARGTSREAIARRLGGKWTGVIGFQTGELLIFLAGGKVVRFADYRGEGRFEGFPRPFAELPREHAVLHVRQARGELIVEPAR